MASHWYQEDRTVQEEHITANVHERLFSLEEQNAENKAWKRMFILMTIVTIIFCFASLVMNKVSLSTNSCKDSIILDVTQKGQNIECPYANQNMEIVPGVGVKCSCNRGN